MTKTIYQKSDSKYLTVLFNIWWNSQSSTAKPEERQGGLVSSLHYVCPRQCKESRKRHKRHNVWKRKQKAPSLPGCWMQRVHFVAVHLTTCLGLCPFQWEEQTQTQKRRSRSLFTDTKVCLGHSSRGEKQMQNVLILFRRISHRRTFVQTHTSFCVLLHCTL